MKKIGIDARFYSPRATGIGRHVFELIRHLSKKDPKNQYFVFLNSENFDHFQSPGDNFTPVLTKAKHYSLAEQTVFLFQINRYDFDLMIFPQFNVPIFYRKNFLVTIHDLTIHFYPGKKSNFLKYFLYKKIIHNAIKKAQHVFAVSQNTKKDIMKFLDIESKKITVTYNGVSVPENKNGNESLKKFREKFNLPEKYFLYTGVFRCHKNIKRLIGAYAIFVERQAEKNNFSFPILVLAGPDNPLYTKDLKKIVQEKNLEEKIIFTGFFPEKYFSQLLKSAWVFVFPSLYEGFGIPPLEAMQAGVPVASSNTSSLPEICGDSVLYFDPKNTVEMAEALEKISFDENLRKSLVEKGNVHWPRFTWEKMVDQMWSVYQTFL